MKTKQHLKTYKFENLTAKVAVSLNNQNYIEFSDSLNDLCEIINVVQFNEVFRNFGAWLEEVPFKFCKLYLEKYQFLCEKFKINSHIYNDLTQFLTYRFTDIFDYNLSLAFIDTNYKIYETTEIFLDLFMKENILFSNSFLISKLTCLYINTFQFNKCLKVAKLLNKTDFNENEIFSIYSNIGNAYFVLGNVTKALLYFKKSYEYQPFNKQNVFHIIRCLVILKDSKNANIFGNLILENTKQLLNFSWEKLVLLTKDIFYRYNKIIDSTPPTDIVKEIQILKANILSVSWKDLAKLPSEKINYFTPIMIKALNCVYDNFSTMAVAYINGDEIKDIFLFREYFNLFYTLPQNVDAQNAMNIKAKKNLNLKILSTEHLPLNNQNLEKLFSRNNFFKFFVIEKDYDYGESIINFYKHLIPKEEILLFSYAKAAYSFAKSNYKLFQESFNKMLTNGLSKNFNAYIYEAVSCLINNDSQIRASKSSENSNTNKFKGKSRNKNNKKNNEDYSLEKLLKLLADAKSRKFKIQALEVNKNFNNSYINFYESLIHYKFENYELFYKCISEFISSYYTISLETLNKSNKKNPQKNSEGIPKIVLDEIFEKIIQSFSSAKKTTSLAHAKKIFDTIIVNAKSETKLGKYLKENIKNATFCFAYGIYLLYDGKTKSALKWLAKATNLDPAYYENYNKLLIEFNSEIKALNAKKNNVEIQSNITEFTNAINIEVNVSDELTSNTALTTVLECEESNNEEIKIQLNDQQIEEVSKKSFSSKEKPSKALSSNISLENVVFTAPSGGNKFYNFKIGDEHVYPIYGDVCETKILFYVTIHPDLIKELSKESLANNIYTLIHKPRIGGIRTDGVKFYGNIISLKCKAEGDGRLTGSSNSIIGSDGKTKVYLLDRQTDHLGLKKAANSKNSENVISI